MRFPAAILLLLTGCASDPSGGSAESARYLRPSATGRALECTFTIRTTDRGWSIVSVTERGALTLTVTARYDARDMLEEAEAVLVSGDSKKTARVATLEGKAWVEAAGRPQQDFDAPRGVIVTSEPDWTDTFLLCRLRDRRGPARQELPGLWIHPDRPAQRLTFSVEKQGEDTIEGEGGAQTLDRLEIRLRGGSRYVAWADSKGRMIRLVSIPMKSGGTDLILEGFESRAAGLRT